MQVGAACTNTLDECKTQCLATLDCQGIAYAANPSKDYKEDEGACKSSGKARCVVYAGTKAMKGTTSGLASALGYACYAPQSPGKTGWVKYTLPKGFSNLANVDLCALSTSSPDSGWKACAKEHGGGPCTCSGYVRFGAPGHWSCSIVALGQADCSNSVFGGDPWPGHTKACYCLDAGVAPAPAKEPAHKPQPTLSATFQKKKGCCRTQNGGTGTLKSKGHDTDCEGTCRNDKACVAFETSYGSTCEIHKEAITKATGTGQCMCYIKTLGHELKGPVPNPSPLGGVNLNANPDMPGYIVHPDQMKLIDDSSPSGGWGSAVPTTHSWQSKANLPWTTAEAEGAACNGKLYVFGGFVQPFWRKKTTNTLEYNPANNKWSYKKPIPLDVQGISHMGQAVLGDDIYLAGGLANKHGKNWSVDV